MRDVDDGPTGRTYAGTPVDVEQISDGRDSWTVNLVLSDMARRSMVREIAQAVVRGKRTDELCLLGRMHAGAPGEPELSDWVMSVIPAHVFEVELGPSQAEDLAEALSEAACEPEDD